MELKVNLFLKKVKFYLKKKYFVVNCGDEGAAYDADGNGCQVTCSPDGVNVVCGQPGCKCLNWSHYYHTNTNKCSTIACENLNCVGKVNEQFYGTCQSSGIERCGSRSPLSRDCRTGCLCKPGFCRENGVCVPRAN
jgi:hypothetical protein